MSREQLVSRLLAREASVPSQNMLTGQLSPDEWRRLASAAQMVSATDMRIDDNSMLTVADMNAQCRRLSNLGLVVIDYLQLMQSVSDISRMLKIMAKELNVPVICLSQLNRAAVGRSDKRPMLNDLRDSGAIEQDADVVIGLHREGYYDQESSDPYLAEAIVLKNRKGQTGTVYLQWLPEFTSFGNRSAKTDDDY